MNELNIFFILSAVVLSVILLVNFLILLFKYNKEKYVPIITVPGEELLKKHGPIICSCILQKRGLMPRDIIGTLVGLVQKDIVDINIKRTSEDGEIINIYTLNILNPDFSSLSEEEENVLSIVFNGKNQVVLNDEVSKIDGRCAILKRRIKGRLEMLGANTVKVPKKNKIIDNFFFILVCIFFVLHLFSEFDAESFFKDFGVNIANWCVWVIKIDALLILFTMLVRMIILVFERIKCKVNKTKIEMTDSITVNVFAKFIFSNAIVLLLLIFAGSNLGFIADIVLFDIAMLVMITDDLFVAHSPRLNKDYLSLKEFEVNLSSKAIIDFFTPEKEELLKYYIPFIVCSNIKGAEPYDYVKKLADITVLDKKENDKYNKILKLVSFNEQKIAKFYFSDEIK
ncbi:MAG: DUF2207 domain-containing protein [Clostridia bacterium]|nr:DUF2207 domain-containing protein [Clostridia bacterium]